MISDFIAHPIQSIARWTGSPSHKYIYAFSEGSADDKKLLGNKGSLLCEMTRMGLPVPPGFVVTTEACNEYFIENKVFSADLTRDIQKGVHEIERQTKMTFGGKLDDVNEPPLLLSVRSGAAVSMPGMMDTVLNLGINDRVFNSLLVCSTNPRYCYDTYRRFLQMYGTVVLGINGKLYEDILTEAKHKRLVKFDYELNSSDLQAVVNAFKKITPFPEDPWEQLHCAVEAVFSSWFAPRATKYRDIHNIPNDLGTAVTIQSMVYGNLNSLSGSGVAFTRNPVNGEDVFYGEYLDNCEGEDVVSGARTPETLQYLQTKMPAIYDTLFAIRNKLEKHFKDMQDIEFTVESGNLYILQTRAGKRTAKASVRMAVEMVREALITEREALLRIDPHQLEYFLHDMIDPGAVKPPLLCRGLPASPGCAQGRLVFNSAEAETLRNAGERVILCREETSADDIGGLYASAGVITLHGGMTSHAAVVARGMGRPAVVGVGASGDVIIDEEKERIQLRNGQFLSKGDLITLDGCAGLAYIGEVQMMPAVVDADYQTVIKWADKYKRMGVFANAESAEDIIKAVQLGAEGLGLCRTEHMFFCAPERLNAMRAMILADSAEERSKQLDAMLSFQQADFLDIFRSFSGKVVTVRFLDPPLHEFLPSSDSMQFEEEIAEVAAKLNIDAAECKRRVAAYREKNPMLGFRGCRLSIIYPEITEMQTRAAVSAAIAAQDEKIDIHLKLMIPLVTTDHEIEEIAPTIRAAANRVFIETGKSVAFDIGTMLEVPRACLRADAIVREGDVNFVSFGTNDLTQMTYGFSRDDSERFLPYYVQKKLVAADPFTSIDTRGVGALISLAINKIRRTSSNVAIGVCGEQGGDPQSIEFFDSLGVHYTSVSPFRIPIAKVAAARAHLHAMDTSKSSSIRNIRVPLFAQVPMPPPFLPIGTPL